MKLSPVRLRRVCFGMVTLAVASCAVAGPSPRHPILKSVAVQEATVNAKPSNDVIPDEGREWFRQLVVRQATASARRAALDRKLARLVETGPDRYQLRTDISVPVTLPPGVHAFSAAFQKGGLAEARLQLVDGEGVVQAMAEGNVRWREVRWTTGGPKFRRPRLPEAALLDAVEAAVNRAMRRLVRMEEIKQRAHHSTPSATE